MKELLVFVLSLFGWFSPPSSNLPVPTVIPTPTVKADTLLSPVPEFSSRITKKSFGTYVNPSNSPVSPEKFTGYHTGVDIEFADVAADVEVKAVYDGQVIYSGRAQGYGGVVAQAISFDNQDYLVVYGHLNPSSMVTSGSFLVAGQSIGTLGQEYSSETDNERRHLHLSFLKGHQLNLRGYVTSPDQLSAWVDPLTLLP